MLFRKLHFILFLYSILSIGCSGSAYKNLIPSDLSEAGKQNIITGYNNHPFNYSDRMGRLMMHEMHILYPEFAEELAEVPELQDGIDEKEAIALIKINDILQKADINVDTINSTGYIVEVKGKGYDGEYLSFSILNLKPLAIVSIQQENFEPNDKFSRENTRDGLDFNWTPNVSKSDTDTLIFNVDASAPEFFRITYGGNMGKFPLNELDSPRTVEFEKGFVTIRLTDDSDRTAFGLVELTKAGQGGFRFSAPMQALIWGYVDGVFLGNPLKDYTNMVDFIKPVWGDMNGPRWKYYGQTIARLTEPILLDYYERANHIYEQYDGERFSAAQVHMRKKRNCVDSHIWREAALSKSPYWFERLNVHPANPHTITLFKKDGKYYVMDNGYPEPLGILGPFNKKSEIPYRLVFF